jgi:hypothetical protein
MELETAIVCPLIDNKSRLNLADLNVKPTDPIDVSDKFMVRMTMINKCKHLALDLGPGNNQKCNLTEKSCIFRELPEIGEIKLNRENFDDEDLFSEGTF